MSPGEVSNEILGRESGCAGARCAGRWCAATGARGARRAALSAAARLGREHARLKCEAVTAHTEAMNRLFPDYGALAHVCGQHRIRRLALFGSVLKRRARPDSDVDLLVEFEPGATPGLLRLAEIEQELSMLLGGRKVDLRTAAELSRYFREDIVSEAEEQYRR